MAADDLTLTIGGQIYGGWTEISVTRAITQMASTFSVAVSERWLGQGVAWPIKPWSSVEVRIGEDLILTGTVDEYAPSYAASSHGVRITGRSKTSDLVDCSPEIDGGQFKGYRLDAIARAVAKIFGLNCIVRPGVKVGDPFPDATIERAETAYEFIERLCRVRSVFACDDEAGNLVLAVAGGGRSAGALVEGGNILAASARFNVSKRFSKYIVRTQRGLAPWTDLNGGEDGGGGEEVAVDVIGTAIDTGCPRYRPHVTMGEAALTSAQAAARAKWQALVATGKGSEANITVPGWRQPDNSLWVINQQVPVISPRLGLDRALLTASVTYSLRPGEGRRTTMVLGPPEAYTPDPVVVKTGPADMWHDVNGVKVKE
jgi:prophage tail gpP-like protein